ncbi:hypothetical protein [Streptomyces sp. NPDC086023]|uniref:hypothetical protein n=1 Tax=Streptomyces sp. NPDC086023 TaxID=3365746 RepID=UPI0037D81DB5
MAAVSAAGFLFLSTSGATAATPPPNNTGDLPAVTASSSDDVVTQLVYASPKVAGWRIYPYQVACPPSHRFLVNGSNGDRISFKKSEHVTATEFTSGREYHVVAALPYMTYSGMQGTYYNWDISSRGWIQISLTCTNDFDKAKLRTDYIPVG